MFAFAIVERDTGRVVLARDRLGIKPLYLAETPAAAAVRLDAARRCWPAGGVDTSHRPGRAAPLPDLPRRRAGAAHDPARASASCRRPRVRVVEPDGTQHRATATGTRRFERDPEHARLVASATGRTRCCEALRTAVDRRHGRRRAGRRAALRRPRLQPDRRRCWPRQGQHGPGDVLHRLRVGRRRDGRRVRATPTWSPSEFGTDHHQIRIDARRLLPALDARDRAR